MGIHNVMWEWRQWLLVGTWVTASITSTIINKTLVSGGLKRSVDSLTLSAFHFGVAMVLGYLQMQFFAVKHQAVWLAHISRGGANWRLRTAVVPACFVIGSKVLTYYSYRSVETPPRPTVSSCGYKLILGAGLILQMTPWVICMICSTCRCGVWHVHPCPPAAYMPWDELLSCIGM